MRLRSFLPVVQLAPLSRRLAALKDAGSAQGRQTALAGLISIGLRALVLLGKFAFIVALAKYTDTATVGIYALLVTTVSVAIYVIGLEIHTYTGREIVSDRADGKGAVHVQSHLLTVTAVFLIALPFIWGFTTWLGLGGRFSFLLFGIIVLLEVFGQELGRYLIMLSRPVAHNILQFIRASAWMPVPVALMVSGDGGIGIDTILWSWLGGSLAACLFGFWHVRAFLAPLHPFRLDWLGKAFLSARHYFAVALLSQVQYYSDRFVVQYFMGENAVGVLSFYQSFANTMVAFVHTGVISVMLPRLLLAAKHGDFGAEARVRRSMFGWGVALAAGISVALAIGMPFLMQQMDKAAYLPALPLFYILLFGNLLLVVGVVVHMSLYARRKDAQLMRVSLVVVPLGLLVNTAVVPIYGIFGAATVFCLVSLLDLGAKSWLLRREILNVRRNPVDPAKMQAE